MAPSFPDIQGFCSQKLHLLVTIITLQSTSNLVNKVILKIFLGKSQFSNVSLKTVLMVDAYVNLCLRIYCVRM